MSEYGPDASYLYGALHEGADPEFSTFRTAPVGRAPFTFTSFGDQGTPTMGKRFQPPEGMTIANPPYVNDNMGSPWGGDTTAGVERLQPLFHLFNGDLCYANIATDRVRTWWDFWDNNSRSARKRPWMPSAGNHENELGNGPIGYQAYQTYFSVPEALGQSDVTRGLWYAFTAGSVRVISIANDDVVYQDGLVVCGHEHHYERSHPIRGRQSNPTLTPVPAATATDVIDTTKGTVHMVIGGGGTSSPSNTLFFNPPQCRVITAVGMPDPKTGKRPPVYIKEEAPWSAVRNAANSYGFAAFIVDPGAHRGGLTTIKVTYYDVVGRDGQLAAFENFTLRRPRRD